MPRRSTNSVASNADEPTGSASRDRDNYGVEDLNLPKTMIQRLAKGVLPPNTQITKDALLAISKSSTVFVNYLAAHANENAQRANKKTIQPKDIFDSIYDLGFDVFLPRLQAELEKYNTIQCDKRNTYRRKVREEQKIKAAANTKGDGLPSDQDKTANGHAPVPETGPAVKKMRRNDDDMDDGDQEQDQDEEEGEDEEEEEDDDQVEGDNDDTLPQEDPLEERERRSDGEDEGDESE
ncbi:histone-fold-containing protein [Aulographum hederae CBS 113979]|uniref:DNA polymerase epsilon subunit D n=1 Tax=Aulographum hederae CBS 113979 TaxID=1176131 RepID=A0A6G1H8Y6_9PEZI|nr:histone-fold-containing protein [Aulographum hederae CBS 113979]